MSDRPDWGTVSLWTLAMSFRESAGATGTPTAPEESAWLALAQTAVHLTTLFQKAPPSDSFHAPS